MRIGEGSRIGAYRVLAQIGEGGMGTVWLAEHTMLGRRAAIKLLHPMFKEQPDVVTRFFNEARAATAISDPGIVQIFDFGHHVDGSAYIAMEMLEGEPLDRRLQRMGRLPAAEALRIIRQVASSLGVAHQRGIVHRDLKPENIFLVRDPEVPGGERPKILDFGIAKLTGDPSVKTSTSAVMGTPAYMSPEQCRGAGHVDQRSDVYALGCMLFMLLTGNTPFMAEGAGEIIAMHLREAPPAPSSRVPGILPEIDVLVLRCLAKDPGQRFPSGEELAAEIGTLFGTLPAINQAITGSFVAANSYRQIAVVASTTLSRGAHVSSTVSSRPSNRGIWLGALALVSVGGVIMTSIVMNSGSGSPVAERVAATPTLPPPAVVASPTAAPPAAALAVPTEPQAIHTTSIDAKAPESSAELAGQMKAILSSFVEWSETHAGAPCPSLAALAPLAKDPWGHPLAITCTDQPANQLAGVISAGPDSIFGTQDDLGSWQMSREVTDVALGHRWVADSGVIRSQPKPARNSRPKRPAAATDSNIPTER